MLITTHVLDKMWQYLIKARAGCCCEMCGSGSNGLHAAHIIGRVAMWTRWRLRNGLALCVSCHVDSKIKAWLMGTLAGNYLKPPAGRWRWVCRQKQKVHRGRWPDLRNEYRRLRTQKLRRKAAA